jgi:hypothetical protein
MLILASPLYRQRPRSGLQRPHGIRTSTVCNGRIVCVARPAGFGVLQPFKRQVSPLAERPVVAEPSPMAYCAASSALLGLHCYDA